MSFYNASKNPFPFYNLEGEIWTNTKPLWFKNQCKGNCCYLHKIATGLNYFQLQLDNQINSVSEVTVELRLVSDNTIVEGASISNAVFSDANSNRYLVITFNADNPLLSNEYYISVETPYGFYYSETFCISQISNKMITIEWSGSGVVGSLIYPNNYKHSVNIEATISISESEIEEETEEDGFGNETPTLQILKQRHTVSFVVPNFLAQALSALKLHSAVNFVNRKMGETPVELTDNNLNINVTVTPEIDNCFSYVEITYDQNTVIKTGCDNEIMDLSIFNELKLGWLDTETTEDRSTNVTPWLVSMKVLNQETEDLAYINFLRKLGVSSSWQLVSTGDATNTNYSIQEYSQGEIFYKAILGYATAVETNELKITVT